MQRTKSSISQQSLKPSPPIMKQHILSTPHYLQKLNNPGITILQITSSHNEIYTSLIYFYLSQILFHKQQTTTKLLSLIETIQMPELMIVEKQTLPKHLQQIYEFKSLKSSLSLSLQRLTKVSENRGEMREEVLLVLAQPLSGLSFILLFRYLVLRRYNMVREQIWVLGNQEKVIRDFREDARGNVLRILCLEIEMNVSVDTCNKLARSVRSSCYTSKQSLKTLNIVLEKSKAFVIQTKIQTKQQPLEPKKYQQQAKEEKHQKINQLSIDQQNQNRTSRQNSKPTQKQTQTPKFQSEIRVNSVNKSQITITSSFQTSLQLQSDTSTISTSQLKSKNCLKCGRIKTEKFCICRKGREDSAPKAASKFQPGIITSNCRKCFLSRPLPGENYCRECKVRLGK